MMFTIYANRAEEVRKKLDRLAVKAARYNVSFGYSLSEEYPKTVSVYDVDPATSTQYETAKCVVAVIDVDVDCEEFIKAEGWTVRARLEHGDRGNVVTTFGFSKPEPAWYKLPGKCDHCNTVRTRKVTFICENADGEIKQVGRACLKDYTGINPATACMWAEVRDLFNSSLDCYAGDLSARGLTRMYDVRDVFAHAYDEIKRKGYRKSEYAGSTRDAVTEQVLSGKTPSDEGLEVANAIIAWLKGLDENAYDADMIGSLERNCISLVLSGYAPTRHFGRLAYMPVAYEKFQARETTRKAREASRQAEAAGSKHVGEVGQRITIKMDSAKLLSSWDSAYGITYLYKFVDESGNVYIWYASRAVDLSEHPTIKATVKDHNERDGVKQTVLTRCKVA